MDFKDLQFIKNGPAEQARHDFQNGYGVSVIRGPYTYGGRDGLYELAVMVNGDLFYDSGITEDVIGYLTPDGVTRLLGKIEALPARQKVAS